MLKSFGDCRHPAHHDQLWEKVSLSSRKVSNERSRPVIERPGDVLFVGSDGPSEQEDAIGDMFVDAAVAALLMSCHTAKDQVQRVLSAVDTHAGDEARHDDQTVLVLRPAAPMAQPHSHSHPQQLDPREPQDPQVRKIPEPKSNKPNNNNKD